MCIICGLPNYMRCNCESQQPYCDQCSEDSRCSSSMDAQCVIYHFETDIPTKLINLGIGNGANLEYILEEIDKLIGSNFNIPFQPINTRSIRWTVPTSQAGHIPKADVILSNDSGQIIVERVNGLYANNDHKVKVDANDQPDYLELQIMGIPDASGGGITTKVAKSGGILQVSASIDVDLLAAKVCSDASAKATLAQCLLETGFTANDTASVDLNYVANILTANAKISPDGGNIITIHSNGLYASGGGTGGDARNGLHLDGSYVELGGTLLENTLIDGDLNLYLDNNILLLGSIATLGYTQPVGYSAGEDVRLQMFHKTPIRGGSSSTSRFYNAHVLDNDSLMNLSTHQNIAHIVNTFFHYADDATFGSNTQDASLGVFLSVSSINSSDIEAPNMIAAVLAGVYFDNPSVFGESAGTAGTIDNMAIFKTQVPSYQSGMNSGNTPQIDNLYGLFLTDLAGGSAASKFTNKFGVYQEGATDVNRFFGTVQNAGGGTEFTSDVREKENIRSFSKGLDELQRINTYNFNYKYNKEKTVTGVIAQELEVILPEAVKQGEFKTPLGIKYDDFRMVDQNVLFYTMLNAIKELSAEINELKAKS